MNPEGIAHKKADENAELAVYLPFIKIIVLAPNFLKKDLDTQIFILLHEFRHYQQNTGIIIPADVIEYAKSYEVKTHDSNIINFFKTGFFWTRAMKELDADLLQLAK